MPTWRAALSRCEQPQSAQNYLNADSVLSLQLVAAVPAGLLTDKCRRDTVLRIAAAIGLVAGLTLTYCLFFSAPVWCFMIAMGLVGAYKGFNNPAIESIFADSVQRGKRCVSLPLPSKTELCL